MNFSEKSHKHRPYRVVNFCSFAYCIVTEMKMLIVSLRIIALQKIIYRPNGKWARVQSENVTIVGIKWKITIICKSAKPKQKPLEMKTETHPTQLAH